MNTDTVRKYCLEFPQSTENLQWGDDLCFKIRGKMFAVLGLDNPRLSFKCTPETFAELIERENIEPAPYVGRYKWVILERLDALRDQELKEFLRQSYEMVEAKAPGVKSAQGARKKTAVKPVRRKMGSKKT
jgi:predicted DNA-binding protein (MmcQ/YjbR family)